MKAASLRVQDDVLTAVKNITKVEDSVKLLTACASNLFR